eukprot:TRINITY_DN7424_c0_g1_i1.p1 TRINITY_DN7424_c0_g1~~TRINITY_DN7424_c0_g1_i1.p1  ORF type:complete len:387 (+),score=108.78 TRINITY_DN7424_c0_g1_i1:67-1161(+)
MTSTMNAENVAPNLTPTFNKEPAVAAVTPTAEQTVPKVEEIVVETPQEETPAETPQDEEQEGDMEMDMDMDAYEEYDEGIITDWWGDNEMQEEVDDETWGDQSEEVSGPGAPEEEARLAAEMRESFKFQTDSDVLRNIGNGQKRVSTVVDSFFTCTAQDTEATQMYDSYTSSIDSLEKEMLAGIAKNYQKISVACDYSGSTETLSQLSTFLRVAIQRAVAVADYSEHATVEDSDVVHTLNAMGVTLYWNTPLNLAVADEDEEDDSGDYSEEEDSMVWEETKEETAEVEEEFLPREAFSKVVQILMTPNETVTGFSASGVSCLYASAEQFLSGIVAASAKCAAFAKSSTVSAHHVRFSRGFSQRF